MDKKAKAYSASSVKTILGYGLGGAGVQFSWALISSYLTIFYSDAVGLAPVVISAIMLGARIWDAINDPMFGAIAENYTHTRWGRFRPYLLFGSPLLALFSTLTFLNLDISSGAKAAWCTFTYIGCGMIYTAVGLSMTSLPNCMTTNNNERAKLVSSYNVIGNIASLIINAVAMPLILYFGNNNTSEGKGYFVTALVFSLISIPCLEIAFASTKEVITIKKAPAKDGEKKQKNGFLVSLKTVFGDHDARMLIVAMICVLIAIMGRMGIQAYYFVYVLGNAGYMSPCATAMSIGMLLPGLYCPFLFKRMNKKTVGALGCVLQGIFCVALFFAAEWNASLAALVILHFLWGACNTQQMACFTLAGEIVDNNWIHTGHRMDGIILSCISFATKLGNAVGGSIGILALAAVGYVANTTLSARTITGMNAVINIAPVIFFAIGAAFFMLVSMTNKKGVENEEIVKKMLEDKDSPEEA